MGIASLSMALGYRYRIAAFLVFMSWGYLYAVESTRTYWMSYYYLELLISFLMVWLPAHQCWSLDAFQKKTQDSNLVPFWTIAILRFQLFVMYFYARVCQGQYRLVTGCPTCDLLLVFSPRL